MNLADLDESRFRVEMPRRPMRGRSQINAGWKHRYRGDRAQVEFLAQAEDTVIEETMSPGRVRRVRQGHRGVHEYNPFWRDLLLRCLGVLDGWRERRRWKRERRCRRERHAKMLEAMERRLRGPAFVCRLPSESLR